MKNDILNGFYDVEYKGTNDFRSTKVNVAEAWLYGSGDSAAIGVVSEETQSGCRTGESRGITGCGRNGKNGNGSIHIRLEPLDPPESVSYTHLVFSLYQHVSDFPVIHKQAADR